MWDHALQIASGIHDPIAIVAFGIVFASFIFWVGRKTNFRGPLKIFAVGIFVVSLAPLAASTFLSSRGIYRVRVTVLGPDRTPIEDAQVSSSSGGEPKKTADGWEFDIPPQSRPADNKVVLRATVKNAFLSGQSTVFLDRDYYPTSTIEVTPDTSATIRGVVLDERLRSVAGASVSIAGYGEGTVTDRMGNFVLQAHAADGQIVQVRAQKGPLVGNVSAPAGRTPVQIILKRR